MALLMWHHAPQIGMVVAVFLLCAAWMLGAAAERWMACAFGIQFLLAILQQWAFGKPSDADAFSHFMPDIFAQDLLSMAIYVAISLRANRLYPLWIAAAQLIAVTAHILQLTSQMLPQTYATLVSVPLNLQALILCYGIAGHALRTRRGGNYPAWRQA